MEEIKIGNQIWMAQNLNVDCFKNNDQILEALSIEQWIEAGNKGIPAWCYHEENSENKGNFPIFSARNQDKATQSKIQLGKLYNWFAINDTKDIAPKGWKVPSDNDWTELIEFLGGKSIAGEKMKFTDCWDEYYRDGENGTNESGFFDLPGGFRLVDGRFTCYGEDSLWWSSSESDEEKAWCHKLTMESSFCYRGDFDKKNGFSVRCIKI
jgi:uncharacterized protein (TIGR02145 family)